MCGYNYGASESAKRTDIVKQFDIAVKHIGDVPFLKLYTSGSFLDECEVPSDAADHILKHCSDSGVRLLFESRPEYVTSGRLGNVLALNEKIEIAIGLESANDRVLKYSVNKGFTVADYQRAAELLNDRGVDLRSYVLLKPPFLTEAEAVADSIATIEHASKFSATVSLNPVNVQKGTLVENLWRNWAYRPPWLWSVLNVLKTADTDGKKLVCDPTGGGKERGAHNCGDCDHVILDSIKAYSMSQDKSRLGSPECGCAEIWKSVMDLDGFVMGGTCDIQRHFRAKSRTS